MSGTGTPSFVYVTHGVGFLTYSNLKQCDVVNVGKVSSVKFGPDAKYIAAVGPMDRNLRIYGLPGGDDPMDS